MLATLGLEAGTISTLSHYANQLSVSLAFVLNAIIAAIFFFAPLSRAYLMIKVDNKRINGTLG